MSKLVCVPHRSETQQLNRSVVLRGLVFAIAIALGAVAVWLIVTSTTQKGIELGVLAGLWGLLLGAFSMIGARRVVQTPVPAESTVGAELELRSAMALERSADAQARREYEARLEQLLREEVRATMGRELAEMRAEIAQLRSELLEKVGGQLRLERIETTRLIGSDLEALQDEVRKLKFAKQPDIIESGIVPAVASLHRIVEPGPRVVAAEPEPVEPMELEPVELEPVEPEPVEPEPVELEPVEPEPVEQVFVASTAGPAPTVEAIPVESATEQTAPIRLRVSAPAPTVGEPAPMVVEPEPTVVEPEPTVVEPEPTVVEPEPTVVEPEPTVVEPEPTPEPTPEPVASAGASMFDELSALPRLRPFTDIEPDPVEEPAQYRGRRRRADGDAAGETAESAEAGHGHRRAATHDGDQDDLLARLLARESVR